MIGLTARNQNPSPSKSNDKQRNPVDNLTNAFNSLKLNSPTVIRSCNDLDMSPVRGEAGTALLQDWASGLDYDPYHNKNLSEWCKVCYFGKFDEVKSHMEKAELDGSLKELLSLRESQLQLTALLHVINGARVYDTAVYIEIADFLLEKDADPNVQDFAGFSALHHCFTLYGNETTLAIARKLVSFGADVNIQNKLGCTALFEPCTNLNYKFMEELITMGCRTDICDNDGISCLVIARKLAISGNIQLHSVFSKAYLKCSLAQRSRQGTENSCSTCGVTGSNLKKCSGCLKVSYCGVLCQRQSWKSHKKVCRLTDLVTVRTKTELKMGYPYYNCISKFFEPRAPAGTYNKKNVIVKVQLPIAGIGLTEDAPMYIYNEDRSYKVFVSPSEKGYSTIFKVVRNRGINGVKAYMCGTIEHPDLLHLNTATLINEAW